MDNDTIFNHYVVEYISFQTENEPEIFPSTQIIKCVYKEKEVQLAKWIERMNLAHWRLNRGIEQSMITEQRVAILSEIGFPWVDSHLTCWENRFNELKA